MRARAIASLLTAYLMLNTCTSSSILNRGRNSDSHPHIHAWQVSKALERVNLEKAWDEIVSGRENTVKGNLNRGLHHYRMAEVYLSLCQDTTDETYSMLKEDLEGFIGDVTGDIAERDSLFDQLIYKNRIPLSK